MNLKHITSAIILVSEILAALLLIPVVVVMNLFSRNVNKDPDIDDE